jgi:hypothetical protein
MADTAAIASLATAGGTLVLAVATFSSTRSANRSARISEQALQTQLRPVLFTARADDIDQKVSWQDDHRVMLRRALASVQDEDDVIYLAIPLRNVGSGLAVLHGWHVWPERVQPGDVAPSAVDSFRRQGLDLYVPAGDAGFWQAAVRETDDPLRGPLREAISEPHGFRVELLYGDLEGGQRTITMFNLVPREKPDSEAWLWTCRPIRHWNIDRPQPR